MEAFCREKPAGTSSQGKSTETSEVYWREGGVRRRNNPNGASTRVLGPPAARQRGEDSGGILLPRRQWRQARPPDETDSTTRKKRAQRRRERARAQGLEGDDESNGWAPTTKEPKDESQAQPMEDIPIHASARRGRAEGGAEAEGDEGDEGDAESHYTMADSVCAGGTVERTRRTARPRTAGTACSSWPEGVPRDFSLEASKAPVLFHQKWCFLGCLLVLAWGETTNRTMADGREWYSCRTIRCGSGSWQDCGAGLWNRRQAHGVLAVQRQYSFRRQPEVTQRGTGVTTLTCFLPRGRRV